jgi:hypothetical protein
MPVRLLEKLTFATDGSSLNADHVRPPSLVCDMDAPSPTNVSVTSRPCNGSVKSMTRLSPAWLTPTAIGDDRNHVRPPSAVPKTNERSPATSASVTHQWRSSRKNSLANHPSGAFGGATTGRYERPKSDVA